MFKKMEGMFAFYLFLSFILVGIVEIDVHLMTKICDFDGKNQLTWPV